MNPACRTFALDRPSLVPAAELSPRGADGFALPDFTLSPPIKKGGYEALCPFGKPTILITDPLPLAFGPDFLAPSFREARLTRS
jgi:hypothetical protein